VDDFRRSSPLPPRFSSSFTFREPVALCGFSKLGLLLSRCFLQTSRDVRIFQTAKTFFAKRYFFLRSLQHCIRNASRQSILTQKKKNQTMGNQMKSDMFCLQQQFLSVLPQPTPYHIISPDILQFNLFLPTSQTRFCRFIEFLVPQQLVRFLNLNLHVRPYPINSQSERW